MLTNGAAMVRVCSALCRVGGKYALANTPKVGMDRNVEKCLVARRAHQSGIAVAECEGE